MATEYYYIADLTNVPAGEASYFVINHNTNQTYILPKFQVQILQVLSGCRSLDGFVEQVRGVDVYNLSENILQEQIQEWINMGFIRPVALLNKKTSSNNKLQPKLFSTTITSNRPATLHQWFYTRINSHDFRQDKIPIIVSDDSKDPQIQSKNRKIVNTQQKQYQGTITYKDRSYREELIQRLTGTQPEDIVRFGLTGGTPSATNKIGTYGANRNTSLLATAGSFYYSSDDDLYYMFYQNNNKPEESSSGKVVIEAASLPSYRCYPDMDSLNRAFSPVTNFSLIDEARQYLQGGVYPLLAGADIARITPAVARVIETGKAELRAVSAGYFGGRWYDSPMSFLLHIDETDIQFLNDPEIYRKMKYFGNNMCGFERPTVSSSDFLQGGTMVLDNTKLLPPCFPLGRHEDTAFGILLNRCFENALFVYLPVAAYHDPSNKAPFSERSFEDASIGIGKTVELLLYRYTVSFISASPVERMREVGKRFQDLSNISLTDFENQIRAVQQHYLKITGRHLESMLKYYNNEPTWWAEDAQRYLNALKQEMEHPLAVVPRELRAYVYANHKPGIQADIEWSKEAREEALSIFRGWLGQYGRLLEHWPEIWETARQLNSEQGENREG